jgi:GT2 family glycosyltransferase
VKNRIIVLTTSFNRNELTLRFLASVQASNFESALTVDILVIDDNSSDHTKDLILYNFPEVNVESGDGLLYSAGAIRFGMQKLKESIDSYDGIFLANDDIVLEPGILEGMHALGLSENALVGGTILCKNGKLEATGSNFGLICRPRLRPVKANGKVQKCDVLPGHLLFIPTSLFKIVGPINVFTKHGYADLEYSLRADKFGFKRLVFNRTLAYVDVEHNYFKEIVSLRLSFREMIWRVRFNPKSPPLSEGKFYLKMVSPYLWPFWLPFYYRATILAMFVNCLRTFWSRLLQRRNHL